VPLKPDAEITLEANPGTVDQARFRGFRDAGINRLSIGVQSFQPDLLQNIGRIHNDSEAVIAIEAAHQAGFDNINLDLMFGLPGQSTAQALADLRMATALQPAHISWYELTIEPNTWFHRHPPERPADDTLWDMQQAGRTLLDAAGFKRYEISAYARDSRQCRHNLNYWQFGDYLGIGAGAHAKISDAATQGITRISKARHPRTYLDTAHSTQRISTTSRLSVDDVVLEFAMNVLRLDQGFSPATFTAATGLPYAAIETIIDNVTADGLLSVKDGTIKATPKGQRYLNELLQGWMPETAHN
jgi:oxygen-independent coproporphyrinogen-3 oxidase